jgi:zinc transport system substrate-binding protein
MFAGKSLSALTIIFLFTTVALMREAITVLLAALLLTACGAGDGPSGFASRPRVVASFYPLAFAAEAVAGTDAMVTNLTPAGAEPHDIELTSGQVVDVSEADVLVYAGRGFQPAVESLAPDIRGGALDVLEGQSLRATTTTADESSARGEGELDPHVWLDPTRMATIVEAIANRLASTDPDDAGSYRRNGRALTADLRALDRSFARGLARCESRDVVTSHEAFGYLAGRYGLAQVGIAGLDPESEPSPQRVADVTEFARAHDVTTIFFERLASPRVAEAIAAEAGLETAVLDPLESPPEDGDYFDAMVENLESLRAALRCE